MTNHTLFRDTFLIFFNPFRTINSTEQYRLELIRRNDELVLYTDPTSETNLNSLPIDSSTKPKTKQKQKNRKD